MKRMRLTAMPSKELIDSWKRGTARALSPESLGRSRVKNFNRKAMRDRRIARELFESLLNLLISADDVMKLERYADEQTAELARDVYIELKKRLELDNDENEALNRLKLCVKNASKYDKALLRNNIFKAAHALGMTLPSHSF